MIQVCYGARDVRVEWVSRPTFYFAVVTMDKHLINEHVGNIAKSVAGASGIEVVHVETAGTKRDVIVRIYIDKVGGVTLEDCTNVSRGVETLLDAEDDYIPCRYVLEVSSPGIERELYSLADFRRFVGHLAKVKTTIEIDGQKTFVGAIKAVEGQTITIDDRTQGVVSFSYSEVAKANLKIDLLKEFGRK